MITKNDKNVIGVYKNNTPISRIYKGDKLVFGVADEVGYDVILEWSGGTEIQLMSLTNYLTQNYTSSLVQIITDDYLILYNVDCDYLKIIKYYPERTQIEWGLSRCDYVDLSELDTSKLTDMSSLFSYCKISELDISNWNTSNVTTMQQMFYDCSGLTSLDLSSFNTSKVTTMHSMFYNCRGLISLDISNFNTSEVAGMGYMFFDCQNLQTLNLGDFDMSKVTTNNGMFYNCLSLDTLIWNNMCNSNGIISLDFWNITTLGQSNRQTLADTFVNNSFDRNTAGYSSLTINLHSDVVARFTNEEIAQMSAKGYTISQHS